MEKSHAQRVAGNIGRSATEFSGKENSVFADPVLQGGCQLIDIDGGEVHDVSVKDG